MTIKIAVPDNPMYAPLLEQAEEVCRANNFELIRASEQRCAELLLRNSVELALLSPYGYGKGVAKVDYRIIPGPALILEGLTYKASIYFKENAGSITTCASPSAEDFIVQAGAMVLNEKFNLPVKVVGREGAAVDELLREFDTVISWGFEPSQQVVLDISDEWLDATGHPLPVLFWVCRAEEMPENIGNIVQDMAAPDCTRQVVMERLHQSTTALREGAVSWQWDDRTEPALQKTLELLFFLQYIPEIPAVKLWGRDPIV